MTYDDVLPWPLETDGEGYSLVSRDPNPTSDPNNPTYWRTSYRINGSPGKDEIETNLIEEKQNHRLMNFRLNQNCPNPFNPPTKISFILSDLNYTALKVYNILGQEVATLYNSLADAGRIYTIDFNMAQFTGGVYIYTLKSGSRVFQK
jgi:hypothetical protein